MRYEDIKDKLEYISEKIQELGTQLHKSKIEGIDIKNISFSVGDILTNTTELFDYCARDIYEVLITPSFSSSESKIYFPFYTKQLAKKPFSDLAISCPLLHSYLLKLAKNADENIDIDGTCISSSFPRKIRRLVDDKKHTNIIEVNTQGREEIVGELGGMKFIIPVQQNCFRLGEPTIEGDVKLAKTRAYELKETGEEVFELCVKTKTSTKIVIDQIYQYLK